MRTFLSLLSISIIMLATLHGQNGVALLPDLNLATNGDIHVIVKDSDGNIYVGGQFSRVNNKDRSNLAKLKSDGSVDEDWQADVEGTMSIVNDLTIDGADLYVAGYFTSISGQTADCVARVSTTDGALDPDWLPMVYETVNAVVVNGPDAIYIGGDFTDLDFDTNYLAKIDSDGYADLSFDPSPNAPVWTLLIDNGKLYVGGEFMTLDGLSATRNCIASFDLSDDSLESGFQHTFAGFWPTVETLVSDGTYLYAGGSFDQVDLTSLDNLVKLNLSGNSVETGFTPNPDLNIHTLALDGGSIFLGGAFTTVAGSPRYGVAKVDATDGTLDTNWAPDANEYGEVYAIQALGSTILLGGTFHEISGDAVAGIARVDSLFGNLDSYFGTRIFRPGEVKDMVILEDGSKLVAGNFQFAGDIAVNNVAHLNPDDSLDTHWLPDLKLTRDTPVLAAEVIGDSVFIGGYFSDLGGKGISFLGKVALSTSDAIDETWVPNLNSVASCLATDGTSLFVGGSYTEIDGQAHKYLSKIDPSTAIHDAGWDPGLPAGAQINLLEINDGKLYLGGPFSFVDSAPRTYIAAIDASTAALDNWAPDPNDIVNSLAFTDTHVYVGGNFTSIGERTVNHIAKISKSTGLGESWDPNLNSGGHVYALAHDGTYLYTGGHFTGSGAEDYLLRFKEADGLVDSSWLPAPDSDVFGVFLQNSIPYISGNFQTIGGQFRFDGFASLTDLDAPVFAAKGSGVLTISTSNTVNTSVKFFKITALDHSTLFLPNGVTTIPVNGYVSVEDALQGLPFTYTGTGGEVGQVQAVTALTTDSLGDGSATGTYQTGGGAGQGGIAEPTFVFDTSSTSFAEDAGEVNIKVFQENTEINSSVTVNFATSDGSATAGVNYSSTSGLLTFGVGEFEKSIPVTLIDDTVNAGDKTVELTLSNPSSGGTIIAPNPFVLTVIDQASTGDTGSDTTQDDPDPIPASTGSLTVLIDPVESGGKWKLLDEDEWRNSGDTISDLELDNYQIELKNVSGYTNEGFMLTPVLGDETWTVTYTAAATVETGNATIYIQPQSVAENADVDQRGQWRFSGDASWYDSGEIVSDKPEGSYQVEFKFISGLIQPAPHLINIGADATYSLQATYRIDSEDFSANEPTPIDNATLQTKPYSFVGLIRTRQGIATGTAVKPKIVLTAAHVIFDDNNLSYVPAAYWFHQRHKNFKNSEPKKARGWYVYQGYASQRKLDQTPGISSAGSQNLDVAALYFHSKCARGAGSGYLASDNDPSNPWLTGSANKMLIGYPYNKVSAADRYKMHATAASTFAFNHSHDTVYSTTEFESSGGNSGGPIMVEEAGKYYPAAIYLGGTSQSLVKAIDSDVVDLINRADNSSKGGGNHYNGFAAFAGAGSGLEALAPGKVTINLNVGRWFLEGIPYAGGQSVSPSTFGIHAISFEAVAGYTSPASINITVSTSDINITASYTRDTVAFATWASDNGLNGADALPLADLDNDGIPNLMEYALALDPNVINNNSQLPQAVKNTGGPANSFLFRFQTNGTATGITYSVMVNNSLDPGTWTLLQTVTPSTLMTEVVVDFTGLNQKFVRLEVSE